MGGLPYRTPNTPPDDDAKPADPIERLGSLRSSHRPIAAVRALAFPILTALLVGLLAASGGAVATERGTAMPVVLFAAVAAGVASLAFGVGPLRDRSMRLDLHARGLVLARRGKRTVVHFDDVDEVWYDLERSSTAAGVMGRVVGLRFVDGAGAASRVPLSIDGSDVVFRWVLRHCSMPLLDGARKALRGGQTLTFGRVTLDAETVAIGGAAAAWRELRLVRLQPGRVVFFRRLPLVPWRTVDWEHIPHPTVFVRLVMELAPRLEKDNPIGLEEDP